MAERPRPLPRPNEARIEQLLAQLAAYRELLALRPAQITRRIDERKERVRDALEHLGQALDAVPLPAGDARDETRAAMAELRTLLGRASVRTSRGLERERQRIAGAGADLDGGVAAALARLRPEAPLVRALRRYRSARSVLDTELRIAAACLRRTAGRSDGPLDDLRSALAAEVAALEAQLEERRARLVSEQQRSAALWRRLDAGLRESVDAVDAALERLLG